MHNIRTSAETGNRKRKHLQHLLMQCKIFWDIGWWHLKVVQIRVHNHKPTIH